MGDNFSDSADGEQAVVAPSPEPAQSDSARTESNVADKLAIGWGVIVAGVVLVGLIVLLAAVKRGLDFTDESDYIQSELHAGSYLRASTEFQLLLGPVLSLVKYVWALRVAKVVGLVAAHAFFAWCFFKTAPSLIGARFRRSDGIAVGAAIIAAAFAISRVQPQTPGYNDITIFIVVTVSGLLLLLADARFRGRAESAAWFAVGVLIWFQFLARWPSAAAIVPLAAITFLWTGFQLAQLLRRGAATLAGAIAGAVVTQLFLAPVSDIVRGIHQGNTDASAALNYSRSHLLSQYVTNISDLARVMSHSFWFLLAAALVVGLALGTRRFAFPVALAGAAGLVILTPVFILSGRARGGVMPFGGIGLPLLLARSVLIPLYITLALLAGAAALIVRRENWPTLRGLAILLALLVAPFLGGLGSNNPLWYTAALNPGLWVAAALALCALTHRDHGRLLVHGLAFALAALIAFTAFDGTWRHPYRQAPLAADTVNVQASGPLSGLSSDPVMATFLEQTREIAAPVAAAQPTTMVVWTPGIPGSLVSAGLSQPLFAWLSANYFADLSLAAACRDHTHAILLFQTPSQPVDFSTNADLSTACAGRNWTSRGTIAGAALPVDDLIPEGLTVSYAAPLG